MRFHHLMALGGLAAASEAPVEGNEYVAKFTDFVANMGSYIPNPDRFDPVAAEEARTGDTKMHHMTLSNWWDTLYAPVQEGATESEDFWMLVTGRNLTCWGQCEKLEARWNETAAILAQREHPPHIAMLNCDDQPVLCNSWSAGTSIVWVFSMLPPPAEIVINIHRLNATTTTTNDLIALYDGGKDKLKVHEGAFHPFNGWVPKYQLHLLFGYLIWILNVIPSWSFMLIMSFMSRSLMNRNMAQPPAPRPRPAGAAAAAN